MEKEPGGEDVCVAGPADTRSTSQEPTNAGMSAITTSPRTDNKQLNCDLEKLANKWGDDGCEMETEHVVFKVPLKRKNSDKVTTVDY